MTVPLRVLIVEDSEDDAELVVSELRGGTHDVTFERVDTATAMNAALDKQTWDIVIADYRMPHFSGTDALKLLQGRGLDLPFIIVSGTMGEDMAVAAMRAGAHDYIMKGNLKRLVPAVERELRESAVRKERRRAEETLRQSEERYRTLAEAAQDAIFIVDRDRRLLYVNSFAASQLGTRPDQIIGKRIDELFPPEVSGRQQENLQKVFETSTAKLVEDRIVFPDRESWLSTSLVPIKDERGEVKAVLGLSRDITERKNAERQIREQASLLDKAQDAIGLRDLEGRILYWNKGAERLYGWTREEIIGQNADKLLYEEESPQLIEARKHTLEKGEWTGELRQVTKDRKEIIVESRWNLIRDNGGRPRSILVINTDITEKKKLEAQFLRAQRMQSLGTLAGGIAHDLNNVLAPILMSVQILKTKLTDETSQRVLATVESSARRGSDIVKQVLTFARGVEGERGTLQLAHLIRELEKICNETFPKAIQIRTDIPKDLWTVTGDATQLHQVLVNLCLNARDAMPKGGRLTIEAENVVLEENYARMHVEAKPGSFVVIKVSDTGTGIPSSMIDKIFEPFFTTKTITKGTGLGLATVSALVRSHGGFVNVYSEVDRGSTFKVYLPATKTAEGPAVREAEAALPLGHGEVVLIVDDENSILDIGKTTLEMHGYRVLTASDGTEAVVVYAERKRDIAVVLTDMMMPYMDGPATVRALRKMNPDVKVITMSGVTSDRIAAEASNLNVSATLRKPFTTQKLLKTLNEVVRGT